MALTEVPGQMKLEFTVKGDNQGASLSVVRAKVTEGLNRLFNLDLLLAAGKSGLAPDQYVGHAAALKAVDSGSSSVQAQWQGMLCEFKSLRAPWSGKGVFAYQARVRPSLWKLAYSARSRVLSNMTRPDAVKQALKDGGIKGFELEPLQNTGAHPKLEHVVQYQETDLDFVLRLMRQEGLSFFYLPVGGGYQFSSVNEPSDYFRVTDYHPMLKEQGSPGSLTFKAGSGLVSDSPHVDSLGWGARAVPGHMSVQTHFLAKSYQSYPPTGGRRSVTGGVDGSVFMFQDTTARQGMNQNWTPQNYADKMTGVRAEELAAWSQQGEGTSNHVGVRPCLLVQFSPDPLAQGSDQAQYQVTEVEHRWRIAPMSKGDADYANTFSLVKKGAPIRPAYITPWPPRPV